MNRRLGECEVGGMRDGLSVRWMECEIEDVGGGWNESLMECGVNGMRDGMCEEDGI